MIKIFLFSLFSLFAFVDLHSNEWHFYGDGVGKNHDYLELVVDYNQTETAYFEKTVEPGTYRVSYNLELYNVQKSADGFSLWNFYDIGNGTQSVFTDQFGDLIERKVSYSIKVDKKITFWFRLKSPGKVKIKNFKFERTSIDEKVMIEDVKKLTLEKTNISTKKIKEEFVKLFNFETDEDGHPFKVIKDKNNNRLGEFNPHKYYNFNPREFSVKNLKDYDRILMDVYNPNSDYVTLNFTISDELTTDYWTQLNHIETLAPGWNRLSLSLKRFVGERGSVRVFRKIDYDKLKKIFLVIDPDKKIEFSNYKFLIDNIYLQKTPNLILPSNVLGFDFTSEKAESNGLVPITTKDYYSENRQYGFIAPKFWRVDDDVYTDSIDRYSIGITAGKFRVNLPNGKYKFILNIDKLGYWDVPFYVDRTVLVNDRPVFKESRINAKEFMSDLLRFENIDPTLYKSPYDQYSSLIFRPIIKEVEVDKGYLEFSFFGDESAISLNSLIIWNLKDEIIANNFLKELDDFKRLEYSWLSRSLNSFSSKQNIKCEMVFIELDTKLLPEVCHTGFKKRTLPLFNNERQHLLIQIPSKNITQKIKFRYINLEDFDVIPFIVKNQFISPDLNHETYFLGGKYLKEFFLDMTLPARQNNYLVFKISKKNNRNVPKIVKGAIEIKINDEIQLFNLDIININDELSRPNIDVGFLSLDPLPFSHYKGKGYDQLRREFRFKALEELSSAGFTTFSGLPEVKLIYKNSSIELEYNELRDTLRKAIELKMHPIAFSFGGQFPEKILDMSNIQNNLSQDEFYKLLSPKLKSLLTSLPAKVVYMFSDEAGGYSNRVEEDFQFAKKLRYYFPFLNLGGFGFFYKDETTRLNNFFDYGLYSKLSKDDVKYLKSKNMRWGMYNASSGSLDDPRFSMGLGLYLAEKEGLTQYLEWNSVGFNNYPFLDFDGRESDITIFYPSKSGNLLKTIRFIMAEEGLNYYRTLKWLEKSLNTVKDSQKNIKIKKFIDSKIQYRDFYKYKMFLTDRNHDFKSEQESLNQLLLEIL